MLKTTLAIVIACSLGCVSSQQVTDSPAPNPDNWEDSGDYDGPEVQHMDLSQSWGEVGKPFRADLRIRDNINDKRELSISKLPPGLRFDKKTGAIVGVPEQRGFYVVNVAVRQQVEDRPFRYAQPSDRWFTEEFELRIYNPISD